MKRKKIDIIITTFNRSERLKKTLDILSRQTEKDFNLIINDDGSKLLINPNDYPIITKYIWNLDDGYHRVARFNESISFSTSEKIILLDDDCVPQSEQFIEKYIELLDEYDIIKGRLMFDNGLINGHFFSSANIAFNKGILNTIGELFDNNFDGSYGYEDIDLGYRIKNNKNIRYFDAIDYESTTVKHGSESYKDGDRSIGVVGKNKKYLEEKCKIKINIWGERINDLGEIIEYN